jgi:transposase
MKIIICNSKQTRTRSPNNKTTTGYRLSDALWAVLQPLLPVHLNTHRFGGGRPRIPDHQCANTICDVLRTGCPCQALNPTELCAHSTAHDRYQEWSQAGVFLKLWQAGLVVKIAQHYRLLRGIAVDHGLDKTAYEFGISLRVIPL